MALLLGDGDPELARALGEVIRRGGHRAYTTLGMTPVMDGPGVVPLLELGLAHEDWWAVLEAAEAVGSARPRADAARPALERVAESHWSSGVRAFATEVLHALNDPGVPAPAFRPFANGSAHFPHGYDGCIPERGYEEAREDGPNVVVPQERRWRFASGARIEEREIEDWPRPVRPAEFPTVCFRPSPRALAWVELPRELTAIRAVEDGWLVSVDKGEFGGATLFVARNGTGYELAEAEPFKAFVDGPDGLLGIYGLCHGSCETGNVQRLERRDGRWRVTRTTTLPSSPRGRLPDAEGALLLATEAGVVKMLPGGTFEFLGCR
jgi:hypothetical protein